MREKDDLIVKKKQLLLRASKLKAKLQSAKKELMKQAEAKAQK